VVRGPTFGQLDGPAALDGDPPVSRDSRGNVYVPSYATGGLLVFDSTGTYVRTVGRRGRGPGEFELVTAIAVGRSDTLFVFDRRNMRVTILTPTHEYARMAHVASPPLPARQALLPDGDFVIAATLLSPDAVGHPLHLLDANFEIERSFGATGEPFTVDDQLRNARLLTSGGPGQVWATHLFQHVLELWSTDGTKIREVRRTAEWLPPPEPRRPWRQGEPLPPPRPGITMMQSDDQGYIWILGRVIDQGWKPPRVEPTRGQTMLRAIEEQSDDDNYDTMIEVVEAATGNLVASLRHDLFFNQFAGLRTLAHRDQHEDGRFLITTYRLQFVAPTSISQGGSR
jgi:hypothetical protein